MEVKEQRELFKFQLRKSKNEELFSRKRVHLKGTASSSPFFIENSSSKTEDLAKLKQDFLFAISQMDLPALLIVTKSLRKVVSNTENPKLEEVFDLGLIECFFSILKDKPADFLLLSYEVSWILSNFCAVEPTRLAKMIEMGLLELFFDLLSNEELFENVRLAFPSFIMILNGNRLCGDWPI